MFYKCSQLFTIVFVCFLCFYTCFCVFFYAFVCVFSRPRRAASSGLGGDIEPKSTRTLAGRKLLKTTAPSLPPPQPTTRIRGARWTSSAHAQVSTGPSTERSREPDRRGQRGGPIPAGIVRKRSKTKKKAARLVSTGSQKCYTVLFSVLQCLFCVCVFVSPAFAVFLR